MTDLSDDDLARLDTTASRAARGLREHVLPQVDADLALARIPASAPRRPRGRLLTVAAALAVLVGSVAVLSDHNGDDGRSRLELDEDGNPLPVPQPGTLTPLGPRDGKDSIELPLTVAPSATGLHDGDTVTVSAPGFEPGESVGLVQCAQEAGGETPEQRGGIDACDISPYTSITADGDGVATGDYQVQRFLTTPLTGTVDCGEDADRCLVALGALSDYDRSGGLGITFAAPAPGEPTRPKIPTLTVTPAKGLHDGDVVHVEGAGYEAGTQVDLQVCAKDPSACWVTGEVLAPPDLAPNEDCFDACGGIGLLVDRAGRLSGDVPVWRFLPGEPGTYVDCALSECALRVQGSGETAPAPARLGFLGGGDGPRPPAVAVDPDTDLTSGDRVVVRGAGFEPRSHLSLGLCSGPAGTPGAPLGCTSWDDGRSRVGDDGTFALEFEIPDLDQLQTFSTTCAAGAPCPSGSAGSTPCDGEQTVCSIRVDAYSDLPLAVLRPEFPAAPVPVTFRSDR